MPQSTPSAGVLSAISGDGFDSDALLGAKLEEAAERHHAESEVRPRANQWDDIRPMDRIGARFANYLHEREQPDDGWTSTLHGSLFVGALILLLALALCAKILKLPGRPQHGQSSR